MKRYQLEHAIRAAGSILDTKFLYVLGTASILATHPDIAEGIQKDGDSPTRSLREILSTNWNDLSSRLQKPI
jgi:hypothetical protein